MQSVLIFEGINSENVVEEDRELQPVNVYGLGHDYLNIINSMMDHGWDGFYSSQKRLQRFPILIETGKDYTVDTVGTPTDKLRFLLNSQEGATEGSMIRVLFDNVGKKTVKANGVVIQPQLFDDETRQPKELDKLVCGENRFVTLNNYLEFFITPGCEILVEPNDAIEGAVRMDWTLNEFYASGGTTSFIDRVASLLNIPTYRVYVVEVYAGSVIVGFQVKPEVQEVVDPDNGDTGQQEEVFEDKEAL